VRDLPQRATKFKSMMPATVIDVIHHLDYARAASISLRVRLTSLELDD